MFSKLFCGKRNEEGQDHLPYYTPTSNIEEVQPNRRQSRERRRRYTRTRHFSPSAPARAADRHPVPRTRTQPLTNICSVLRNLFSTSSPTNTSTHIELETIEIQSFNNPATNPSSSSSSKLGESTSRSSSPRTKKNIYHPSSSTSTSPTNRDNIQTKEKPKKNKNIKAKVRGVFGPHILTKSTQTSNKNSSVSSSTSSKIEQSKNITTTAVLDKKSQKAAAQNTDTYTSAVPSTSLAQEGLDLENQQTRKLRIPAFVHKSSITDDTQKSSEVKQATGLEQSIISPPDADIITSCADNKITNIPSRAASNKIHSTLPPQNVCGLTLSTFATLAVSKYDTRPVVKKNNSNILLNITEFFLRYRERPSTDSTSTSSNKSSEKEDTKMNSLDDHDRKVIIEFCHLLEKSKQLFNGLRELPQYGHKQWHSYFGRTFDVYTKLWKFQQQHRSILDIKYGLKRWQIGEIASKIGQLYYHFYLRTSDTAYLNEAFSFYYAIRGRCYYTKACKEDRCELMVKKLRYYARFIVVCLLLKKLKLVRELIKELDRQIIEYGNTYDPDDQLEWTVVVDEVKVFVQSEPVVSVVHPENYIVTLSHRLGPHTSPSIERSSHMNLSLQECVIVGSSSQQVKFSELTLDMFRIMQTLEREGESQHMYDDSPRQRFSTTPSAPPGKGYNLDKASRRRNPHKYLLFKPSPSQVLVYLASGCNDLPSNGALLLYLSADGYIVQTSKNADDAAYDNGGLITTSKSDIFKDCNKEMVKVQPPAKFKELHCLHPGDLYPFTRRPLFVIVDSDNSYIFQNIPRHFGLPMVILMSPMDLPSPFNDRKNQGNLFTLFLHSPLSAICFCCDVDTLSLGHWERASAFIDSFMAEALQCLLRSRIDSTFISFLGDDFLRVLLMRFVFCEVTLRLHRAFKSRHLTRSNPALPDEIFDNPNLNHIVLDLAVNLQIRNHFHDPTVPGGPKD